MCSTRIRSHCVAINYFPLLSARTHTAPWQPTHKHIYAVSCHHQMLKFSSDPLNYLLTISFIIHKSQSRTHGIGFSFLSVCMYVGPKRTYLTYTIFTWKMVLISVSLYFTLLRPLKQRFSCIRLIPRSCSGHSSFQIWFRCLEILIFNPSNDA